MVDSSFIRYTTGANGIAESEHKGYSYKTATSLIENVIAKKERSFFSEMETDGQLAITSSSQEYVDRKGKRVNLTPVQMKLVTAFAQVIDTLLERDGVKEYVKSLPSHIEDRQTGKDGRKAKLPNSVRAVIDIPELTRLMYSTSRIGGKQTDKVREEIKKAELGLITTSIRLSLPDGDSYKGVEKNASGETIGGVGTTHLLTIPYRNGSRLLGFKFRNLLSKKETIAQFGKDCRYRNSLGLTKSIGLFGIGIGVKDVVIVESELDALHAKVMGSDNVVATTGGKATETQIADAKKRGVEKFTLLFDNDERGRSLTTASPGGRTSTKVCAFHATSTRRSIGNCVTGRDGSRAGYRNLDYKPLKDKDNAKERKIRRNEKA